jgi:hypothetical protein
VNGIVPWNSICEAMWSNASKFGNVNKQAGTSVPVASRSKYPLKQLTKSAFIAVMAYCIITVD